jgi:hypothetical protein
MPCNAHESARIINIYYLSLEYNFPFMELRELRVSGVSKGVQREGGFWVLSIKQGPNQPKLYPRLLNNV